MKRLTAGTLAVALAATLFSCGNPGREVTAAGNSDGNAQEAVPAGDADAIARCETRDGYKGGKVVTAYNTTISDANAWSSSFNPPEWRNSRFLQETERGRPDGEPVTLCFVDGGDVPSHGTGPQANRMALVIDGKGEVWLEAAGYHDVPGQRDLPTTRPPAAADRP